MSGQQLYRVEFVDGRTLWRPYIDLEHGTLCRQLGLDPSTFYFDLPSSARGTGSASVGAGGTRGRRTVDGYVVHGPSRRPIAKITFGVREGDRFRDVDPTDAAELLKLG